MWEPTPFPVPLSHTRATRPRSYDGRIPLYRRLDVPLSKRPCQTPPAALRRIARPAPDSQASHSRKNSVNPEPLRTRRLWELNTRYHGLTPSGFHSCRASENRTFQNFAGRSLRLGRHRNRMPCFSYSPTRSRLPPASSRRSRFAPLQLLRKMFPARPRPIARQDANGRQRTSRYWYVRLSPPLRFGVGAATTYRSVPSLLADR